MNRKQMENGPFPILSDVFHIERKQSNLGGGLCFVLDHWNVHKKKMCSILELNIKETELHIAHMYNSDYANCPSQVLGM